MAADVQLILDLLARYGYAVVFVAATLEALPFVGMAVPGQAVVILAGFLASQGHLLLWPIIVAGIVAGFIGDGVGYELGKRHGRRLLIQYGPRFRIEERHVARADELFRKYGPLALVLTRFSFLTRGLGSLLSGVTRMRPAVFWPLNLVGAVLWGVGYAVLGYAFGETVLLLEGVVGRYFAYGALFAVGVFVLYRALRKANPYFSREDAGLAGVAVAAIIAFAALGRLVSEEGRAPLPMDDLRPVIADALAPAMPAWRVLNVLGSFEVLGPVVLVLFLVLAWWRKWWDAALFAIGLGANELAVGILKAVIARARPEDALEVTRTFAFPSGHVAAATVVLGSIVYVLSRRFPHPAAQWSAIVGGAVLIVAMACARVATRAHYPSDTIGGFLVGTTVLCTVLLVIEFAVKRTPGARPDDSLADGH